MFKKLVIIGTIALSAFAEPDHPVNDDIVNNIKQQNQWQPYETNENPFKDFSLVDIKGLLGTIPGDAGNYPGPDLVDVPESFDAREKWGKCVHEIRNQAHCGSCWAFAGSEALSDRFCIASNGAVDVVLSPQDLVSCDAWDHGCNGGVISWAWSYMTKHGVVADDCFPYQSLDGKAPTCPTKCADGSDFSLKKYKCKASSAKEAQGPAAIQSEIFTNGPVETGFTVYEDFISYKSGVYIHTTGKALGGHAVKIIGWGVENGVKYWLIANSWGTTWGENGLFRIQFG